MIEKESDEWQRTAQLASWLMSAWVKGAPSADKLLGKVKDEAPPLFLDAEDFKDFMRNREN